MDTIVAPKALPRGRLRAAVHNARMGFRVWRRSRPFWAGFIALVGGLPMWYFPSKAVQFLFVSRTPIWAGILVGVLVEMFAILLWVQPAHRVMYGLLIVILSLLSFITSDFGGLFIGMLLGILGGSLALAWTPVAGKTKRQLKWLAKSGVIVAPPSAETIVLDEPAPAVLEEPDVIELEPVGLTEAEAASAPEMTIVDEEPKVVDLAEAEPGSDEIDITGWEMPPELPVAGESEAIDLTEAATQQTIDVTEAEEPTIDLREEKATTAPPPSNDSGEPRADGPEG